MTALLVTCSAVTGAAVLRVALGVFYGIGDAPAEDPEMRSEGGEETSETDRAKDRTPWSMLLPPIVLVVGALAVGLVPQLGGALERAAVNFEDQAGYAATVLGGAHLPAVAPAAVEPTGVTLADGVSGVGSAASHWHSPSPPCTAPASPSSSAPAVPVVLLVRAFRRSQSGLVADYVTWVVLGTVVLGGALTISLR